MIQGIAAIVGLSMLLFAANADGAEPVRVGFSRPLTGPFARLAASQFNAFELWRLRVNKAGGLEIGGKEKRPVAFVWRDDGSDPADAAEIYEDLISDDKVDLLLAPWGAAHHMAVAGVVERHGLPLIAATVPTGYFDRLAAANVWFPSPSGSGRLSEAIVGYLKSRAVSNAALMTLDAPFCRESRLALLPRLVANGIALTADEILTRATRVSALLPKIRQSAPGAVLFYGYPGDTALYLNAARSIDFHPRVELVLMGPQFADFAAAAGSRAEGLVAPGHFLGGDKGSPRQKAFRDAYAERFGGESDYYYAPLAYVGAEILEQAVGTAGLDKQALRKRLSTATFDTIGGPIRFEANRNAVSPPLLLQSRDGKMRIVWPTGRMGAPKGAD